MGLPPVRGGLFGERERVGKPFWYLGGGGWVLSFGILVMCTLGFHDAEWGGVSLWFDSVHGWISMGGHSILNLSEFIVGNVSPILVMWFWGDGREERWGPWGFGVWFFRQVQWGIWVPWGRFVSYPWKRYMTSPLCSTSHQLPAFCRGQRCWLMCNPWQVTLDELIDHLDYMWIITLLYKCREALEWFVCGFLVEQWIYLVYIATCYDSLLGWSHYTVNCSFKIVELIVVVCRWPNCSPSFGPAAERRLRSCWRKIREGEIQIWCTQSAKKCKEQVPPHPVSTCRDQHDKRNIPLEHSCRNQNFWNGSSHHWHHYQCLNLVCAGLIPKSHFWLFDAGWRSYQEKLGGSCVMHAR